MSYIFRSSAEFVRFDCPICFDHAAKGKLLQARRQDDTFHLFRCACCETLTYYPLPNPDYAEHTTSEIIYRDYVEMNAGVDIHARQMFDLCAGRSGRLLDIGCGFGFGLDFARQALGWEVRGYEPSLYGERGRESFGLDIRREYAPFNPDKDDLFDVVYCSEVLEHVPDPWDFLRLLVSYLKPDGVLFLTTPDPARVTPGAPASQTLALLSPGFHMSLISTQAIRGMLTTMGFAHVTIDRSSTSAKIRATRETDPIVAREGFEGTYHDYMARLVATVPPASPLGRGMRYRYYRFLTDRGRYEEAAKMVPHDLIVSTPEMPHIATLAEFGRHYALSAPAVTYCRAMELLNAVADYPAAAQHFAAAFNLCRAKLRVAPDASVVEEDLIWQARFHQALALKYARCQVEAADVLAEIVAPHAAPPPTEELRHRAAELLATLG